MLRRRGIDREPLKRKLFHHPPTVRALALTARSIGHYGLTEPQRYVAPLMVVWNITELCNLSCKHCYQESAARRGRDEMTLEQKLRVVDELGPTACRSWLSPGANRSPAGTSGPCSRPPGGTAST